jgi:DMSO/TMAO reductase YedYZ heme-binding membrane subunit
MRIISKILGDDPWIKIVNLAIVLPLSWYTLTQWEGGQELWYLSVTAYIGMAYVLATMIPGNALRIGLFERWKPQLRWLAVRRRTMGLMAALWFWGHYNLAISMRGPNAKQPSLPISEFHPVVDTGQVAIFIFLILFITSYKWAMRLLKGNWRRLHSLMWFAIPFILVHSVSTKIAFEDKMTHISLAMIGAIIAFAAYEFRVLRSRNHPDQWRHVIMLALGLIFALYHRFLYFDWKI